MLIDKKPLPTTDHRVLMRAVRDILRMTQADIARTLRVSVRAVQSYEQGWRNLPDPLAMQLLTLLAVYKNHPENGQACWQQTNCSAEARHACPGFRLTNGRFCWLVAGDVCGRRASQPDGTTLPCLDCPVTACLMKK